MLTIQLLGSPRVQSDSGEIQIGRRKSRALLYFSAAQDRPVAREQLLSIFWPDLPRPSAQQTLRTSLYGLKKTLGESLVVDAVQVSLSADCQIDVRAFEPGLRDEHISVERLESILGLYRGEFLDGFTMPETQAFEDWLVIQREHFRRLEIHGLARLSKAYESQQNYRAAVDALERALTFDALQEDLQREGMRLEYLAGDRPGAIRRYDELRKLLDREMGVPPMAETRTLYDAILTDRLAPKPPETRAQVSARALVSPRAREELPFVGREPKLRELAELSARYALVVVEGEPGIGKTRLVAEYLHTLEGIALIGRARELERGMPYHPIIDALRNLKSRPEWEEITSRLKRDLAPVWCTEIGRLLPELEIGKPALEIRQADEARLWEAVNQFLRGIAHKSPVTLFIDDLHWADSATLALLGYLARQTEPAPVRFLGAAPSGKLRSQAGRFWQTLVRENRVAVLSLERLTLPDVSRVVASLSRQPAGSLVEWLMRNSEGNPYILVELVRQLRQEGILNPDGRVNWVDLPLGPTVPQSVHRMIELRLSELSGPARRVLDAAVAQGREFDFEVVARAAGLSENAALDAIDELQDAGLILPGDLGKFTFNHSLVMEVAYQNLGELRHRMIHRRVAEAMEVVYPRQVESEAGSLPAQLALHFADGNQPQKAAQYALIAGQRAMQLAAWKEAVDFYELALKGLSESKKLAPMVALSEAHEKIGHFANASEVLKQALGLAVNHETPEFGVDNLQLRLARTLIPQARFSEVVEIAKVVSGSDNPNSRITAELLWGMVLSLEGSDLKGAREHLLAAERLWEESGATDSSIIIQIKFELGSVAAQRGDIAEAVGLYRESLDIANSAGQGYTLEQRILGNNNLAYHLLLLSDPSAIQYAQAGLSLAQENGVLGLQTYLYSTLGEIALAANDLDRAEENFLHGLALAEQFAILERVAGLNANLGLVAAARGQTMLAVHRLSSALGMADNLKTRHLSALIRLWLAPLLPREEALQRLAEAREIAEASGRQRILRELETIERSVSGAE